VHENAPQRPHSLLISIPKGISHSGILLSKFVKEINRAIVLNKHRLISIGDSLSQGFSNGCIFETDLSFPGFLAEALGGCDFHLPNFLGQGGLPLNIEALIRGLDDELGKNVDFTNLSDAAWHVFQMSNRVKRYWAGRLTDLSDPNQHTPYHNQAIWGATAADMGLLTERKCFDFMQGHKATLSALGLFPDHAMYITARRVLNPSFGNTFKDANVFDNLKWFSDNGGIENLTIWTGANNAIGAITKLQVAYSEEQDSFKPPWERDCTVFRPEHFRTEITMVAEMISKLNIDRIFVGTIPYITIPPISRGIQLSGDYKGGYFDYYTHYWVWDLDFNPEVHPCITREQAIELDLVIDAYNSIIVEIAKEYDWHLVDLGRMVNSIAYRRKEANVPHIFPPGLELALKNNPSTSYLVDEYGNAKLNTNYLKADEHGQIVQGGIFSLDGLHPTSIGYGLVAAMFHHEMNKAGVVFENDLDWDYIVKRDTLITNPPRLISDLRLILRIISVGIIDSLATMGYKYLSDVRKELLKIYGS
jgi:hypothetical protein